MVNYRKCSASIDMQLLPSEFELPTNGRRHIPPTRCRRGSASVANASLIAPPFRHDVELNWLRRDDAGVVGMDGTETDSAGNWSGGSYGPANGRLALPGAVPLLASCSQEGLRQGRAAAEGRGPDLACAPGRAGHAVDRVGRKRNLEKRIRSNDPHGSHGVQFVSMLQRAVARPTEVRSNASSKVRSQSSRHLFCLSVSLLDLDGFVHRRGDEGELGHLAFHLPLPVLWKTFGTQFWQSLWQTALTGFYFATWGIFSKRFCS